MDTLNVEIEFKDANENMFHSVKSLLNGYLEGIANTSSQMADYIVKQCLLGTFMVIDDDEEDK